MDFDLFHLHRHCLRRLLLLVALHGRDMSLVPIAKDDALLVVVVYAPGLWSRTHHSTAHQHVGFKLGLCTVVQELPTDLSNPKQGPRHAKTIRAVVITRAAAQRNGPDGFVLVIAREQMRRLVGQGLGRVVRVKETGVIDWVKTTRAGKPTDLHNVKIGKRVHGRWIE
jgi:hypothetical protein